jgi:hypothetical protein
LRQEVHFLFRARFTCHCCKHERVHRVVVYFGWTRFCGGAIHYRTTRYRTAQYRTTLVVLASSTLCIV